MCLLCVRMPGADVNVEYLRNANANNSDGSGFAILRSDLSGIDTFCSMDGEEAIYKYLKAIDKDPDCWAMYHARFGTHGTNTVDNVHPFLVGGSKKTVLAHNGILPVSVPHGSKRSDTRIFAENILPSIGITALDYKSDYSALERWCQGSKIAIFSVDKRLASNVYILNEDDGEWVDGTWWSNGGYKFTWGYSSKYNRVSGVYEGAGCSIVTETIDNDTKRDIFANECPSCRGVLNDSDYGMSMCSSCYFCLECYDYVDDNCVCWVPERKYSHSGSAQQRIV